MQSGFFQLPALLTFEMHQVFSHVCSMFCRSFTRTLIQLINNSRQTKTEYFKRAKTISDLKVISDPKLLYGFQKIIGICGLEYIVNVLIDFIGWYQNS